MYAFNYLKHNDHVISDFQNNEPCASFFFNNFSHQRVRALCTPAEDLPDPKRPKEKLNTATFETFTDLLTLRTVHTPNSLPHRDII